MPVFLFLRKISMLNIIKLFLIVAGIFYMTYSSIASADCVARRAELMQLLFKEIDGRKIGNSYQTALKKMMKTA